MPMMREHGNQPYSKKLNTQNIHGNNNNNNNNNNNDNNNNSSNAEGQSKPA